MGGFRKLLAGALLATATLGTAAIATPAGAAASLPSYPMYDVRHVSPKVQVGYGFERKTNKNHILVGALLYKSSEIPAGTYHVNIVYGSLANPSAAKATFVCDLRLKTAYRVCTKELKLNVDSYPAVAVSITRDDPQNPLAIAFVRS